MADITVTNPGSVNAADEAFGTGVAAPPPPLVDVPSSNSGNTFKGGHSSVDGPISSSVATSGTATDANQTVDVAPPQTAGTNVNGGTFSPQSANTINTTQNNVVGQVLGQGTPKNVFV